MALPPTSMTRSRRCARKPGSHHGSTCRSSGSDGDARVRRKGKPMKAKLPRPLDLAVKRLAQERARRAYDVARRQLEREAAGAIAAGGKVDALIAEMQRRAIRAAIGAP